VSIIRIGSESTTLDKTTGLQNTRIAISGEDNDDNDAGFATLNASFASRLFDPILSGGPGLNNTFAQNAGIAVNNFITLTDGSQIQGFVDGGGNPVNAFVAGSTDPTTGTLASFTTVDATQSISLSHNKGEEQWLSLSHRQANLSFSTRPMACRT
jgi:hypothetical protein